MKQERSSAGFIRRIFLPAAVCTQTSLSGEIYISRENYDELREDLLALTVTMIDIIDGAAYLFNKSPPERNINWKLELERKDLREALKNELPPPI